MTAQRVPRAIRAMVIAVVAAALVLLPGHGAFTTQIADSAARLSVTSATGTNKAATSGATTVTVTGSGFQSINHGFGGIYVVFGYVANSNWQPSKGGTGGKDFLYVADSQAKNNKGYQRFVAFPGSSTAASANGGTIAADGTFKVNMVIPGPTFSAATNTGGTSQVDCREVQCGIITFGAHGVVNGTNEAFQPVSFAAATNGNQDNSSRQNNTTTAEQPGEQSGQGASTNSTDQGRDGSGQQPATEGHVNGAPREALTSGDPTLGLEQQTVIAGRSLGFTGRGFAAGEQVVATLSSGLTAAGPITAGQFGEIAGAVQIPADMTAGTHKIKLTGAGSAASAESEFSVMADAALLTDADTGNQGGIRWAMVAVMAAAALLFILVLSSLITALARKDRKPKKDNSVSAKKKGATAKKRRRPARRTAKRKVAASRSIRTQDAAEIEDTETMTLDRLDDSLERERV